MSTRIESQSIAPTDSTSTPNEPVVPKLPANLPEDRYWIDDFSPQEKPHRLFAQNRPRSDSRSNTVTTPSSSRVSDASIGTRQTPIGTSDTAGIPDATAPESGRAPDPLGLSRYFSMPVTEVWRQGRASCSGASTLGAVLAEVSIGTPAQQRLQFEAILSRLRSCAEERFRNQPETQGTSAQVGALDAHGSRGSTGANQPNLQTTLAAIQAARTEFAQQGNMTRETFTRLSDALVAVFGTFSTPARITHSIERLFGRNTVTDGHFDNLESMAGIQLRDGGSLVISGGFSFGPNLAGHTIVVFRRGDDYYWHDPRELPEGKPFCAPSLRDLFRTVRTSTETLGEYDWSDIGIHNRYVISNPPVREVPTPTPSAPTRTWGCSVSRIG